MDAARLLQLQREEREVHEELVATSSASGEGLDGMEMLGLMLELMGDR